MDERKPLLGIKDLHVSFDMEEGTLQAVRGIDMTVRPGEILGIVGESGCGKSVTCQAMLRILPRNASMAGEILLHTHCGQALEKPIALSSLKARSRLMRSIRGRDIAMIFQEPMTAFSPVHTVGSQIMEGLLLHRTRSKKEAREIAVQMLGKVGIADPARRVDEYAFELSGGMRQRAMIAMALSLSPRILIADEPTTALDVTVQAQVLALIKDLQRETGMSVIYITHDLGVIAEICDRVAVMYLGSIMEQADTLSLFARPLHPYTRALLDSIPRLRDKGRHRLKAIEGNVPLPVNLPAQCPFFSRCPKARPGVCDAAVPPLCEVEPDHFARCFLVTGGTV